MSTFLGFPTRRGAKALPDGGTPHGAPGTTAGPGWADDVPHPDAPLRWGETFPEAARQALQNTQLRRNLAHATSTIRAKRAAVVAEVDDWEELRVAGAAIKDDVLLHLDEHLLRLEESLTANGAIVHWARDAAEACAIVA